MILFFHSYSECDNIRSRSVPKDRAFIPRAAKRNPQRARLTCIFTQDTAGKNWFDLPKTELTPEFRRDWQLLRMRGLLDPKHQKKTLRAVAPEYSQIGEVIAGPADFYSGRLTRKERKKTLLEEVTAEHNAVKLNSKYAGIQRTKSSGRKAFYQKLVSQRRKARR